jgi:hypothetical protein
LLGVAFQNLPGNNYYPTVGLRTRGEKVKFNFGQEPFKFNIDDYAEVRCIIFLIIYLNNCLYWFFFFKKNRQYLKLKKIIIKMRLPNGMII